MCTNKQFYDGILSGPVLGISDRWLSL